MRPRMLVATAVAILAGMPEADAAERRGGSSLASGISRSLRDGQVQGALPAPGSGYIGGGSCTRASPCRGPRGGLYYYGPNGGKHDLPR